MAFKILSVVGARPNFIKLAAICGAVEKFNRRRPAESLDHTLVHTGQHYDPNMSDSFFSDLDLPKPSLCLEVGSGSHSLQTAKIMERFENVVLIEQPDVVLVVGDVNSTLACALVAKKTWCRRKGGPSFIPKVAHVEAGLRSFDRTMPEEINRIVTDSISDYLFTSEESANRNLVREGIPQNRIFFTGNVMIDTLLRHRTKAEQSTILHDLRLIRGSEVKRYAVLTLHRPANVDDKRVFAGMLDTLVQMSSHMAVIFPAHPRTVKRIQDDDLMGYFVEQSGHSVDRRDLQTRIRLVPPLGYIDFLYLMSKARVVLTDSGGIQEETTILGVPCITLRDTTERPTTIEYGTNVLVGSDSEKIVREFNRLRRNGKKRHTPPPLWDGNAANRIIKVLVDDFPRSDISPAMC